MVALVYPLVEGRTYDWPWWTWTMMAASVLLLVLFVLWERSMAARNAPQLLNYSLIRNRNFLLGAMITTIFASGIPAFFMVISIMLQSGFGLTPIQSGLSEHTLLCRCASDLASRRTLRLGLPPDTRCDFRSAAGDGDPWDPLHHRGARAGGRPLGLSATAADRRAWVGLGFSALFQTVLAGIPHRDAGSASGALQAFQQVGGSIGVALVGTVFFGSLGDIRALFMQGPAAVHAAFASAAADATWYQIATFGSVIVLVFPAQGARAPSRLLARCGRRPDRRSQSKRRTRGAFGRPLCSPTLPDDQRARAVLGEQFHQHHVGRLAVEDDDAFDAVLEGFEAGFDLGDHAA